MTPNIKKTVIFLGIFLLILVVPINIFVGKIFKTHFNARPEIELSRDFLNKESDLFFPYIGDLNSISWNKQDGAQVSFTKDIVKGFYTFTLIGTTDNIKTRIFWESEKQMNNFRVIRIELIEGYKSPFQIWP